MIFNYRSFWQTKNLGDFDLENSRVIRLMYFFSGGRSELCIYYALSLPIELNSQGRICVCLVPFVERPKLILEVNNCSNMLDCFLEELILSS